MPPFSSVEEAASTFKTSCSPMFCCKLTHTSFQGGPADFRYMSKIVRASPALPRVARG